MSEAGAQTIRRAHKVHPIAAVETEYSLWSRDVEKDILPACRELGIGFMAYAPLGRGFLTATIKTLDALLPKDRRREHPRFGADNIGKNAALLAPLEKIAAAKKCAPAQVALAWLLAQGADIVPIPGTKRRSYLEQNCAAVDVRLTKEEIESLAKAFPLNVTAGTRYPEKQLAGLTESDALGEAQPRCCGDKILAGLRQRRRGREPRGQASGRPVRSPSPRAVRGQLG